MAKSQEIIADSGVKFNESELTDISSFQDALALLDAAGISGESVADYGSGFAVVEKETLIGTPMVAVQWRFHAGDFGDFVSVEAVTEAGKKVVFNDGAKTSGIRAQLEAITQARLKAGHKAPYAGLGIPNGLTMTDYYFNATTGETRGQIPAGEDGWALAHSFYLAS